MMTDRTDDFFIPDNEIRLPEELDYSRVNEYIRSAEAFSRSSYQSVYIIDYFRQNFLYVSPNPMFLCGMSPEQMKELGYRFYLGYVPEDEQPMLLTLNKAGFAFFNDIPVDERKDWYISYDFHILNEGKKILVNHKLTPLALTSDGRIWLALCVVSAATHTDAGNIEMHRTGTSEFFEYNISSPSLEQTADANAIWRREVGADTIHSGLYHVGDCLQNMPVARHHQEIP